MVTGGRGASKDGWDCFFETPRTVAGPCATNWIVRCRAYHGYSISQALGVHGAEHDAVPLAALRCAALRVVDPPAGVDESSRDAKWRLGDPNLDPDLVSN